MHAWSLVAFACPLLPPAAMLLALTIGLGRAGQPPSAWRAFHLLSAVALLASGVSLAGLLQSAGGTAAPDAFAWSPWLLATPLGATLALVVQLLGSVIGAFSARYLQGEARQGPYVVALGGVLAAVQVLLLADHWIPLIAAWAVVGVALERLLCFFGDRPFALLAAHKKRLADRLADLLLIAAAALAWHETGSGSFSDLAAHVQTQGLSVALQASAALLVVAVALRSAMLPVHGWLIQVMEAPTPVSALLHAGVVNLGGYVLIRLAPLLSPAMPARSLLLALGLLTALAAGLVMLTRVSIKVRLAWSTVAQMGFMLVECAAGLYTLAALHLVGHSLYKAHAFLSAGEVVRASRLRALHEVQAPTASSVLLGPAAAMGVVLAVQAALGGAGWPWWWSAVLALAWAPLLWLPGGVAGAGAARLREALIGTAAGLAMAAVLTGTAWLAHAVPLGLVDAPIAALGVATLAGMALLYACLALIRLRPLAMSAWRRRCYAAFYLDEFYTRLALAAWPARWTPQARSSAVAATHGASTLHTSH